MTDDADQVRKRATRLFALALKARDDGKNDYADELTALAVEAFDHATEMGHRSGAMPILPATETPQQVAQQQQQPQPDPHDKTRNRSKSAACGVQKKSPANGA